MYIVNGLVIASFFRHLVVWGRFYLGFRPIGRVRPVFGTGGALLPFEHFSEPFLSGEKEPCDLKMKLSKQN